MNFTFKKKDLLKGLITIEKAVPERSFLDIITGILFNFKKNILILEATNLEISIRAIVEGKGYENIKIVLPRNIINIIRSFPDENINIEVNKDNSIIIEKKDLKFNIKGYDAEEYPLFPEKNQVHFEIDLPVFLFKKMLDKIIFIVSRDKKKAVFNGVHFLIEEEKIRFTAADGFRLAVLKSEIVNKNLKNGFSEREAIIPAKALKEIGNILSDEENIKIIIIGGQAVFELKKSIFVTNILSEKYPNIVKLVTVNHSTHIVIDKKIIEKAIERADALKTFQNNTLTLSITEKEMIILTSSSLGTNREKINYISFKGEKITITLNVFFLKEIFKAISSEKIVMSFNGKESPCIIKSLSDKDYFYMVLPIITAEDNPETPADPQINKNLSS